MKQPEAPAVENDLAFEALLDYLKATRGFDFTSYKRPSLMRRVVKRMQLLKVETYADYKDYLEVHPDEFTPLFNTILINVTSFFRDQPAWDYLSEQLLPRLLAEKTEDAPLRFWSAGCASGQETYSLAMALAEALGPEAFRRRVKIYATDMDEEALIQARQASYLPRDLLAVPEAWRKKYFEPSGGHLIFRNDLRRIIIFGRHDLTQDAPISRLDLIICRNVLMYFNAEAQAKIMARLHFALEDAGYLFLGRAEMLLTHQALFTAVEMKHRLFVKSRTSAANLRDRLLAFPLPNQAESNGDLARLERLREVLLETSAVAQLVVDFKGNLALANARARQLFGLRDRDSGRPFQDLEISYRPVDLRSPIERVYTERQTLLLPNVERPLPNGQVEHFDVQLVPLQDNGSSWLGICLTFYDVTNDYRLQDELRRAQETAETSNEELQSTNEELETTNEELQSTVEELETTNEELQSTNEEMETMNEELQSTNEELQALNGELRRRTLEANHATAFANSILASLHSGVIVLDRDFNITNWNTRAEDLWGLKSDEVQGKSFFSLDIGLPVDQLRSALRAGIEAASGHQEMRLEAVNRRGKSFTCHITVTPLLVLDQRSEGIILLMKDVTEE